MKNIKSTIVFLLVAFAFVFAGALAMNSLSKNNTYQNTNTTSNNNTNNNQTNSSNTKIPKPTPTPKPVSTNPSYTLAQVETHAGSSSCWTIVGTNVYNVTSWINQHPGGAEAILGMCGRDATSTFENQHGGQRRPENELQSFMIGTYKQ